MNKVNFTLGVSNRNHCLQLHFFTRKSKAISSFMVSEDCQHQSPSLLIAIPRTFSLLQTQCVSIPESFQEVNPLIRVYHASSLLILLLQMQNLSIS